MDRMRRKRRRGKLMTNREQWKLLRKNVAAWNQWRQEHPDIRPDLSYADLHNTNLSRADLSYANFRGANLRDAILHNAILHNANLRGAILSDTAERGLRKLYWGQETGQVDEMA